MKYSFKVIINFFLINRLSTRTLFMITYIWYIVCCMSMFFLKNVYFILPFCTGIGILLTSLTTLPYQMISEFHLSPTYNESKKGKARGMGTDCSLMCSCYFLSQIIISLFMSHLLARFGNKVILVVSSVFSLVAIFMSLFYVKFPNK